MVRRFRSAARLTVVLAAVGALTWLDFRILRLNSASAAFTYLLLILSLATKIGKAESVAASAASMVAYDYFFLPPIGTLTIADPQNLITLATFFVTAFITSHLSSTVRAQADESAAGKQQVQRMYDFSRGLMLTEETDNVAERAAHHLITAFGAKGACVFSLAAGVAGREGDAPCLSETVMQRVSDTGEPWFDDSRAAIAVPIRFGGRPLGSLGVVGAGASEVGLYALTQLVAAEMERARAQEEAARMMATRESEHLKSILLDALAHEFKTPLTSIKAAVTAMLSRGKLEAPSRELATVIDEETDRLNVLVSDAIELARVESGGIELHREIWAAEDLVRSAVGVFLNRMEDHQLKVRCEAALPYVYADRKLAEIALRQLLINALLYSPPGSAIEVSAALREGYVALGVSNEGPAIAGPEQQLLFQKFYRGESVRGRVAGSGMGLSIARDIAEAHGGRIWLESDKTQGVQFWFTLPAGPSS